MGLCLAGGTFAHAVAADPGFPDPRYGPRVFDIPAKPLSAALEEYSAATGISLLVDGGMTAGRVSAPVQGVLTHAAALQTLLDSTGLAPRYVTNAAFTLVPAPPAAPPADPVRESYFAVIQAAVERALCRGGDTRPGGYRSVVRLWIDRTGVVRRAEVLASTGQVERDSAIGARLDHLDLRERPRFDLPQPVTLVLLPRAQPVSDRCPAADPEGRR